MASAPAHSRVVQTLAVLAGCLLLAACAGTSGEQVAREERGILDRLGGRVMLEAEYKRSDRGGGRTAEPLLLREEVALIVEGTVYDPRFLRFTADAGLLASHAKSLGGEDGFDSDLSPVYDVSIDLLPEHSYPIHLFALQSEERDIVEARVFSPVVDTSRREYGGRVAILASPLLGNLRARHSEIEAEGFTQDRRDVRDSLAAGLRYEPVETVRTDLQYDLERIRSEPEDRDDLTQTLSLDNILDIGDLDGRPRATFRTSFLGWLRRGTTTHRDLRIREFVDWRITEDIESRSNYQYSQISNERDTSVSSASQSFSHRLYDSLTTTVTGHYSRERPDDGVIESAGGSVEVGYRKRTDLGSLTLEGHYGLDRRSYDLADTVRSATGESHALTTGSLVLLENPDVDLATVVVSDAEDGRVYSEGQDYRLLPRGRQVEVVREPDGRIPEGGEVLVDYAYLAPQDLTLATGNQSVSGALHLFDTVLLYGRAASTRQDAVGGRDDYLLEDVDSLLLSADFGWKGLRAFAEYLDHDSSFSPYRQTLLELSYTIALENRITVGASGSALRVVFDEGDDLRLGTFQGRVRGRLSPTFSFVLEPAYRIERGRSTDRDVLDVRLDLRYAYGALKFALEARYQRNLSDSRDSSELYALLSMERRW